MVREQCQTIERSVVSQGSTFLLPGSPPEFYTDAVRINVSPYGLRLDFGLQADSPNDSRAQAVVRMSPQHAVILYQMLKKTLRAYEDQVGKINMPDRLYTELEIEKEI